MNKIILAIMIAGTAFAGFMGAQIAQSSATMSVASADGIATPAQKTKTASLDDDHSSLNPVVVELFTSQGCSSCPPADMLAKRLAKDESLLVITRPVTYWDRLGWKDTLAREDNTRLQRAYAKKGLTGSGVYTPQIVVNGGGGAVGSREGDIRSLVRLAKNSDGPVIETARGDNGQTIVTVSGKSSYMASVSLLALSTSETVRIGMGENGGRKLHYTNVVRNEQNLGSWTGTTKTYTLSNQDTDISGADKYAVVIQRPGAGAIVGAKLLDL